MHVFSNYGEQLKLNGMQSAAEKRKDLLEQARQVAKAIAISRVSREVTADDVGRVMKSAYNVDSLGPAAGSLFRGGEWQFTGQFVKSKRTTNHSRLLRVWKYVGE